MPSFVWQLNFLLNDSLQFGMHTWRACQQCIFTPYRYLINFIRNWRKSCRSLSEKGCFLNSKSSFKSRTPAYLFIIMYTGIFSSYSEHVLKIIKMGICILRLNENCGINFIISNIFYKILLVSNVRLFFPHKTGLFFLYYR